MGAGGGEVSLRWSEEHTFIYRKERRAGGVRVPSRVGNKCNRVKGQGKIYENDVIKK